MVRTMEPLIIGLAPIFAAIHVLPPILAGLFVAVHQVMTDGLGEDVLFVGGLGAILAYLLWIPIAMLIQWSIRIHFCSELVVNACG